MPSWITRTSLFGPTLSAVRIDCYMDNVLVFCDIAEAWHDIQAMLRGVAAGSNTQRVTGPDWRNQLRELDQLGTSRSKDPWSPSSPPASRHIAWDLVFAGGNLQSATLAQIAQFLFQRDPRLPIIAIGEPSAEAQGLPNICYQMPSSPQIQHLYHAINSATLYRQDGTSSSGTADGQDEQTIVGSSQAMQALRTLIQQIAPTDSNVLILGQSGTGKELVAKNIHKRSPRRNHPFVPLNCGAVPENLLESELFGHKKGAFTGAITARKGRFELAHGGTLFLDEIGDMPADMQVKLLRVLEEREFEPVGGGNTIKVDVRVIAATHRNLSQRIEQGEFREDLYYRLNVLPIEIPALKDHPSDIPALVHEMLRRAIKVGRGGVQISGAAIDALCACPWPGNIRELSNLIERLSVLHAHTTVSVADLPSQYQAWAKRAVSLDPTLGSTEQPHLTNIPGRGVSVPDNSHLFASASSPSATQTDSRTSPAVGDTAFPEQGLNLREYLKDKERHIIQLALEANRCVVAKTARALQINRTTLIEKMRKLEIKVPEKP